MREPSVAGNRFHLLLLPLLVFAARTTYAEPQEAAPGEAAGEAQAESVRPFEIHFEDALLEDLRQRLDRTRFPDQLDGAGWDYGTELGYLRELVDYWRAKFDWRAQERRLNQLPQFVTEIDGLEVHFIHVRSKQTGALPLVMTHGWPATPFEFEKVIGPLTDPVAHGGRAEDAFHVVCPSMPGYAFSEAPRERGFSAWRVADTVAKLMARLGYQRYGAQGGDWGYFVSSALGQNDAQHVAGIHLNLVWITPPAENPERGVPPQELQRHRKLAAWWEGENAYGQLHGTKPQTLGYGLTDSPAGLAAWIVEKWRSWSDCNGDIESRFNKDEILTNIMIYWGTRSITSSARLYYETFHQPPPQWNVRVPTAVAVFPREIWYTPRKWIETAFNLTRWTEMPRGGHFAAMEEPELLVEDIRAHFRGLR